MKERSPILVCAIAGNIGSGTSFVSEQLRHTLYSFNYSVEVVDISLLILLLASFQEGGEAAKRAKENPDLLEQEFEKKYPDPKERTKQLQLLGNQLRENFVTDVLAVAATTRIIKPLIKTERAAQNRIAFIVDSLKHPAEAQFFKSIFGDAFFLVGVVANDRCRFRRLRERKGYNRENFKEISATDAGQDAESGQQTLKTVLLSDYIVSNEYATKEEIRRETDRLANLIFGVSIVSPRQDEFAMNIAFKAAARSACLSRQVGAAITDRSGDLLATGYNDVPQFGGGLYDSSSTADSRCWARGGKCYNDVEKAEIADHLTGLIMDAGLLKNAGAKTKTKLHNIVLKKSRLKQLIEFSRAVHAEMAALISLARKSASGLVGGTLYCTTYPCHNCAKHIVAAGIARVVYLKPYEKSLAVKLHSDAINDSWERREQEKVDMDVYGGVAPSRYEDFFTMGRDRKKNGDYVDYGVQRQELLPLVCRTSKEFFARFTKISNARDREIFQIEKGEGNA